MDVHLASSSSVGLQPHNVKGDEWTQKKNPQIPPGNKETSTIWTERKTIFILIGQQGENSRLTFPLGATHFWMLFWISDSSPQGLHLHAQMPPRGWQGLLSLSCHYWLWPYCLWAASWCGKGHSHSTLPHLSEPGLREHLCQYNNKKKHLVQAWGSWAVSNRPSCFMWTDQGKLFGIYLINKGWAIQGEQARKCKWKPKEATF